MQEIPNTENLFIVYQSIVRHALLAWQRVENGIVDEHEIIEVIGRIALVKYFFEQAQESEQSKINSDSRFWTHVMDHIVIHIRQTDLTKQLRSYIEEAIGCIRKKCWDGAFYNE
ncbi:MAG TPA: hypothetical protein VL201_02800 [Patescibacteria group bacterium]|nr:hypothetical protein [Patescibacteria group bacterium]